MDNLFHHSYKPALAMEPIALLDSYVQIRTYKERLWRKVTEMESIPPHQVLDMGAIATGVITAKVNAVNMDLYDGDFGQWRWFPLDNFQAFVFLPAAIAKWQLKTLQVGIDRSILYRDPLLLSTEMNTWEDERPAFQALNFTDYALQASRIIAFGFRFLTEAVEETEEEKAAAAQWARNPTGPKPLSVLAALKSGKQQFTIVPCSAIGTGPNNR